MTRHMVALAGLLALAGCSTIGGLYDRMFGTATPAEKPAPLPPITQTSSPRVLWQASVGAGDAFVFAPAVAGDAVHAASVSGQVTAFELATGKPLWRGDAGARLSAGVGSDGRTTVVATARGEVIALGAGGQVNWRAQVSGEVLGTPAVADATVLVRSGDGRVHALDARDGKRRWTYERALPPLVVRSPAGITAQRGAVFAGFPGGRLVGLSAATGVIGWEASVSSPRGATELERIADVVGAPALDQRAVCAASFQGRIACFDPSKGTQIWARELSSLMALAIDARLLFATDEKGALHALDRDAGASLWRQERLAGRGLTAPAVVGRYVVVGDYQGYLHVLNRDDGSFAGRAPTDGSAIRAQPVPTGQGVIVQTRAGGLFHFALP